MKNGNRDIVIASMNVDAIRTNDSEDSLIKNVDGVALAYHVYKKYTIVEPII